MIRNYKFGCRVVGDEKPIIDQMFHGHRYKNKLIEIELKRREERNALSAQHLRPDLEAQIAELEQAEEALVNAHKAANKAARAKVADPKALKEALKPVKAALKELRKEKREALKAIREDESLQAQFAEIDRRANVETKKARAATEAYWGTYLLSEDAVKAAKKKPTLRFHRWDGSGGVQVQIQKGPDKLPGMEVEDLFRDDNRIQLELVDHSCWLPKKPGSSNLVPAYPKMKFRIGSEGRDPIWATFSVKMHRPLPPGRVKAVKVFRERTGLRFAWKVMFVVDLHEEAPKLKSGPSVAVDLGWRKVEGGLRVATATNADGEVDTLVMPWRIVTGLRKVDSIKSAQDTAFNLAISEAKKLKRLDGCPEWMREDLKTIHSWKSTGRLAVFVLKWAQERFEGDEELFAVLETWRHQDKHLIDYWSRLQAKVIDRRKHLYRNWAVKLTRKYARVLIEDMDLRTFQEHQGPEEEGNDAQARHYRKDAALSVLVLALKEAAVKRGCEIVLVNPAWTTRACHNCGVIEQWDPANEISHKCTACGEMWDQDVNAAKNILASGDDLVKDLEALATV